MEDGAPERQHRPLKWKRLSRRHAEQIQVSPYRWGWFKSSKIWASAVWVVIVCALWFLLQKLLIG